MMSSKKFNVNEFVAEYLNKVTLSEIPDRNEESEVRELIDESMYDFIYIWTWDRIEGEKEDYFVSKTLKELDIREILRLFSKKQCVTTSDARLDELVEDLDSLSLWDVRYYMNYRRKYEK